MIGLITGNCYNYRKIEWLYILMDNLAFSLQKYRYVGRSTNTADYHNNNVDFFWVVVVVEVAAAAVVVVMKL